VPAPLQRFAREALAVGSEAGGYLVGVGSVILGFEAYQLIQGDFLGVVRLIEILMVTVFAGLSATRIGRLVAMARELLRDGYDHRALVAVLTLEDRALDAVPVPTRSGWRRIAPTVGLGVIVTGLGLAGMATNGDLLMTLGWAAAIAAPLITIRRLWEKLGGGKLFGRLLRGRLGRWVFRLGGVGLRAQQALPAAGERTELALGRAVDDLYRGLPAGQRARLGDVPVLIGRLEADALALRAGAGTPEGAARLATAVAALETLRLDLLKLHAGMGSVDELTRDLDAARALGEQVDTQLEAQRAAERSRAGTRQ
jgi:hypothetical protein